MPQAGVRREVVIDCYYRSIVPLALQAYGFETLHGSAVALPAGVVAMCAPRGTGKSTVAFALRERGHPAVADDAVVVSLPADGGAGPVAVHPLPFALRLRQPSAVHFASPDKRSVLVGQSETWAAKARLSLKALVLLTRHEGPVLTTRLSASQAFPAILSHSYAFSLRAGPRKRAMLSSYLRLANAVPTYTVAFPDGLQHLTDVCEQIERLSEDSA